MPTPQAKIDRIETRLQELDSRLETEKETIARDRRVWAEGTEIAQMFVGHLPIKCLVCQAVLLRRMQEEITNPAP